MFIHVTAMLELAASFGSQVCINADIPEIVALRDRFVRGPFIYEYSGVVFICSSLFDIFSFDQPFAFIVSILLYVKLNMAAWI